MYSSQFKVLQPNCRENLVHTKLRNCVEAERTHCAKHNYLADATVYGPGKLVLLHRRT